MFPEIQSKTTRAGGAGRLGAFADEVGRLEMERPREGNEGRMGVKEVKEGGEEGKVREESREDKEKMEKMEKMCFRVLESND